MALGLVALGAFVFTRPWVLARLVLPAASRAIGGQVTASRVALDGLETLVIEDMRVHAVGWTGDAGEVAHADSMRLHFSLPSLLFGDINVSSVDVGRLHLRLAERSDAPGQFSLLSLAPEQSASATGKRQRPTRIGIEELLVENCVASDGGLETLGEVRFRGSLTPIPERAAAFSFRLEGRPDANGRVAIGGISGAFDGDTRAIDVAVEDVDLDGEQLAVAPVAARTWTTKLGLTGRIPKARFAYEPDSEPTVELDIEGVAMDLPIGTLDGGSLKDSWSGLAGGEQVPVEATPRMTLRSGTLRFSKDTIALVGLKGDLGAKDPRVISVPFECDLALEIPRAQLPPFSWDAREKWLAQAARIAPFSMNVAIRGFRSPEPKPGEPEMLQLPRAVAKVISDFRITAWTLDLETRLERGAPADGGRAAPLRSSGTLKLSRGSGAYREFPYRLDDVDAVISFVNDDVTVERLVGHGAEGTPVTIDGTLVGIATGAEIDLKIRCADAPIDRRLFDSFDKGPRDALGLLFDARAAGGLAAAGLLPDAAMLVEQRRALAALGADEANAAERARLGRSLEAGPFALGGRAGFDLRVYSPAGFGQPVMVTGEVKIRDAGLVFGRFPYPLRIKAGTITVLDEAIVIGGGGLRATTPSGGAFIVGGSVQIPREAKGGRSLRPLIEITAKDDALNPALLAAIPFDEAPPSDWPGAAFAPAGELLRALGLRGSIDLNGFVTTKPDGTESFQVKLDFEKGRAEPDEAGRAWLAGQGLPWPQGFALENCSARLEVSPERVSFENCRGTRGSGSIEARGYADLAGPGRLVEIRLEDLPIDRAFESYLGDDPAGAKARFERYQPSGTLDGTIVRTVTDKEAVTRGNLVPVALEITMDGSRVRTEHLAGRLEVDGSNVRADSLELRLSTAGVDDGILRLSGELSMSALDAQLTGGRIESPVLRELLADRSAGLVALLRSRDARGLYDAHYAATGGERLDVRPRTLSVGAANARVGFAFDPQSSITADPDAIGFDLRGSITEGAQGSLALSGDFDLGVDSRLSARLSLDALALTAPLRETLPPPLDVSAKAIDLTTSGRFLLDLPDIDLRWPSKGSAAEPDIYSLRGEARLVGASFDAGIPFTEMEATLPIEFRYEPGAAQPVDFRSTLASTGAKAMGRALGKSTARIASTADGDGLSIDAAGEIAGGRFDIRSRVDFKQDFYTVRARVAEAGFEALRDPTKPPPADGGGRFTARLEVEGPTGGTPADVAARTGVLTIALRDATLASTPIAMRVLQLTQLMLPINSALQETEASMVIRGNTAEISSVRLASGTLQLSGSGTMDLPTFAVALRLYAKGTMPILSDLIGGLTGAIFAIDVEGTLGEPKVSVAALPGITDQPTVTVPLPNAPIAPDAPAEPPIQQPARAPAAPQAPTPGSTPTLAPSPTTASLQTNPAGAKVARNAPARR